VSGHESAMVAGTARRDAHRGADTRSQQNAERHCLDRSPYENSASAWDETRPDAHHVQLKYRLTALLTKIGRARAQATPRPDSPRHRVPMRGCGRVIRLARERFHARAK
jgi:hypothetical protein